MTPHSHIRWRVYYMHKRRVKIIFICALALGIAVPASVCLGAIGLIFREVGSSSAQAYPLETRPPYTVAIDAGHGHFDTGAKGIINELALCDATAKALYDLLKADTRFSPVLTRTESECPKIGERAATAIKARASVLISIHGNADGAAGTHGFECYPTPPGRKYSDESMRLAKCLANEMKAEGHHLRGGEVGIRYAYYYGKAKHMVDIVDDKVRVQKSFGILERSMCPAVLIEQCFISNADDVRDWAGDAGCERSAGVYYRALCDYFKVEKK